MEFEKIVQKFSYYPIFSKFLKEVYLELVNYFGNEQIVFDALYNTKIINVDNVYDYLKDNDLLDNDEYLVKEGDMKRSSGVCQSVPEISYDPNTNTYQITNVKRCVAVVNLNLTKTHSKATLIHELCHLVKSYSNEYTIDGNILTSHSGLIECQYELIYDGTKVVKKLIKEIGVGLEEGLNSVLEEDITRNIVDSNYQSSGYGVVNAIARNLLQISEIREIIANAQLYHDKSEIFDLLGIDDYNSLEMISDRLYKLNLEMFSKAMDLNKMQEISEIMKEILRNEYVPLRDQIASNFKRN